MCCAYPMTVRQIRSDSAYSPTLRRCAAYPDRTRAAVVMTSSRDAASFQGRLQASSARGFIAKAELSGAGITTLTGPA